MSRVPQGWSVVVAFLILAAGVSPAGEPRTSPLTPAERAIADRGILPRQPLAVRFRWGAARARWGAPVPLEVEFENKDHKLIEGHLELTFHEGHAFLGEYRSPEYALANGKQSFRVTLPAMYPEDDDGAIVRARFVRAGKYIVLGEFRLNVSAAGQRVLTILTSEPLGGATEYYGRIASSLRLERFTPTEQGAQQSVQKKLVTRRGRLAPADLPAHPLGYCPWDVLYLAGSGFAGLKDRQLRAIRRWVSAGGSVLVAPEGGVRDYHIRFLNELAGMPSLFSLDAGGRVIAGGSIPSDGIGMYRSELGRTVILGKRLDVDRDLDAPAWRRAVAFLWKVRSCQLDGIVGKGRWNEKLEEIPESRRNYEWSYRRYGGTLRMRPQSIPTMVQIRDALIPESVRVVPFWLVLLLLGVFIGLVGPGDYYILGFLRRRRYTWIVFPAVCIAFTLLMVLISEHYMGREDRRQRLSLVDVGADGDVLRRCDYEVIFAGKSSTSKTSMNGRYFSPISSDMWDYHGYRNYRGRRHRDSDDAPLLWEGRLPTEYVVTQQVRQWDPQMNRTLAMPSERAKLQLHWDKIDIAVLKDPSRRRAEVIERLFGDRRVDDAAVFVLHKEEVTRLSGGRGRIKDDAFGNLCRYPRVGYFSIVSQISPNAGPDFEDAAGLGRTNGQEWLLVVLVEDEQGYVAYRKLYCQ